MNEAIFFTKHLIGHMWMPFTFILVTGGVLYAVSSRSRSHSKEVVAIAMGVVLAFVSQVTLTQYDDFRKEYKLTRASLRLLKQDAISVYETVVMIEKNLDTVVPDLGKLRDLAPPHLDMPYWDALKSDKDFLLLAQDDFFATSFQLFRSYDLVNNNLAAGLQGDKMSLNMSGGAFQQLREHGTHRTLVRRFVTKAELDEIDERIYSY